MRTSARLIAGLLMLTAIFTVLPLHAQTTRFTYQGHLSDNGTPANGNYDFVFSLFADAAAGGAVADPVNVPSVEVINGVFTVTLDFGSEPFIGFDRWLEIGVRPGGSSGGFTTLTPRQMMTSTPYATFARGVNSSGIIGQLTDSQLSTTLSFARTFSNPGNQFTGTFTGDGSALTGISAASLSGTLSTGQIPGLDAGKITTGTFADGLLSSGIARTANVWGRGGNAGTMPGTDFIGTTDNQPLEFRVGGITAAQILPGVDGVDAGSDPSPNIVLGGPNHVMSVENEGAVIGGGSHNTNNAYFGTINGGSGNTASGTASSIGGGVDNTASGDLASIAGGAGNTASGITSFVGGGDGNVASGIRSTIAGGENNTASGHLATVPGGVQNSAAGERSMAAGYRAKANHQGAFVWADSSDADFASTASDQFLIRAGGNVGINKNNPQTALDVNGTVTATGFAGDGSLLTAIPASNLSGTLNPASIAAGSIQSSMLANGSVGAAQLAASSVTAGALADGSVSAAKLADGSVNAAKLAVSYASGSSARLTGFSVSGSTLTATIAYPQPFPQTPVVSIQSPGWDPASAGQASFSAPFPGYGAVPLEVSGFIFATKGNSSVLEVDGRPAIAYRGPAGNSLKYTIAHQADGRGNWSTNTLATGSLGLYTSMMLVDGKPAIATCSGDGNTLVYAYSSTTDGLGNWSVVTVDSSSLVGAYCSMQLVNGMPAIAYYDTTAGHLKFARASALDGSGAWAIDVVDDGGGVANVGRYCSMAIVGGRPAVSYYDATSGDLKYARATTADGSGAWSIQTIDSMNDTGYWTGLAVVGGKPAIAYSESNGGTLKYAASTTTDGSGAWNVSTVWASSGVNAALLEWNGGPVISARTVAGGRSAAGIWYNAQPDGSGSWTRTFLNSFDGKDHGLRSGFTLLNGVPAVSYHHGAQGNDGQLHFATVPALDWTAGDGAVAPVLAAGIARGADGSGLTSLNAAALTGLVPDSAIPELSAERITSGTLDSAIVPDLDAAKITTGTLDDARIDASIARSANVWSRAGNAGTLPGKEFIGTTDNQALEIKVNNARALRVQAGGSDGSGSPNLIGGFPGNSFLPERRGVVIAGGGEADSINSAGDNFATVSGGSGNSASAEYATIGGGLGNTAAANFATVLGGRANTASGGGATVMGGEVNTASGAWSVVSGGLDNVAAGSYSMAAGHQAKASHPGAFVWADSTAADFVSTANDQFLIRAGGNVGINKNNPQTALDVNGTVTATDVNLTGALNLPATAGGTAGVVNLNGSVFMHSSGSENTFLGRGAGNTSIAGGSNTGIGQSALESDTTGFANTAVGMRSQFFTTDGSSNTSLGFDSLIENRSGSGNVAVGDSALRNNAASQNVAIGNGALVNATSASGNTAVGASAGADLTTGGNNINIGNNVRGFAGESDTIRIGSGQTRAFVSGIRGVTTDVNDARPVVVDSNGQLGTQPVQTEQLRLGPGDFVAADSSVKVFNNWFDGCYGTGSVEMIAPVHVPVGAKITKMTAYYRDDADGQLRIEMLIKANGNGTANGLGYNIITSNTGYSSESISGSGTVAADRHYLIRVLPVNAGWPGDNTLSFQNIVIEWERP